jgi:hypothetical protein
MHYNKSNIYSRPTKQVLGSLHGTTALMQLVRTAQFILGLRKPPVTTIKMRDSTRYPESVPRANTHLKALRTDTSFT